MSLDYNLTKVKVSHKDLDVHIGQKVKFRRSMLGISQDKLGSYLGVTFQQVQKYEKGTNRISASMLYNIANMLNVDMKYFVDDFYINKVLHDGSVPTYDVDFSKKKETKETVDLLKAYYKITDPYNKEKSFRNCENFCDCKFKED